MAFVAAAIGLIVGSFLNVCIFRIPKGESVVWPASRCQSCRKPIAWHDNVPVLSWLALRGKCRACGAAISPQYPVVEAVTGALFALFYLAFGPTPKGAVYLIFALALLVQAGIDLRHQIIPDVITLPGTALGVVASALVPSLHGQESVLPALAWSAAGVLAGGGSFYLIGTVAEWVLKKEALGGGDVKLMAMVGALIGWPGVLWTMFVASLAGSIVGIYLRVTSGEERIPFGPYLALGAFTYLFFGPQAIAWYLSRLTVAG